MKLWRKILFIVLLVAVSVPLTCAIVIQIPGIQTAICKKATEYLNRSIDGKMDLGSIHFIPFHTFIAGNISLLDNSGDTLFHSRKILLNVNGLSLVSDTLEINRVVIDRTSLFIKTDTTGKTNIEAVLGDLFKKEDKDTTKAGMPWDGIKLHRLSINEFTFGFNDKYQADDLNLTIRNVTVGDGLYGTVNSLSLKELSGLSVKNLSTFFLINSETALIKDFEYKDNWSDISIPILQLKYGNFENLSKMADSVEIKATFDNSVIGIGSAGIAVPKFKNNKFKILLDGSIQGKLSNFATKDLIIKTPSNGTVIKLSAIAQGLPDFKNSSMSIVLKNSHTCIGDISDALNAFAPEKKPAILKNFDPKERIRISCHSTGTLDNMEMKLHIESDELGLVDARATTIVRGARCFAGDCALTNVDLGLITGSKDLGKVSTYIAGWAELNPDSLRADIATAEINRLDFKGYRYEGISGGFTINQNHYTAELSSLDTNIYFKLRTDLLIDKKATSHFEGRGNFNRIDLAALNLSPIDTCMTRFMIDFNFDNSVENSLVGNVEIRDLLAVLNSDIYDIGHVTMSSVQESNGLFTASVESSLLNASYKGTDYLVGVLSDVAESVTSNLNHIIPEFKSKRKKENGAYGEFNLVTGNLKPIAALLPKNLYVNSGTSFRIRVDDHKKINLLLSSELLSYEDFFAKDLKINLLKDNGPINFTLDADMLQKGETAIERDTVTATICENVIDASVSYFDKNGKFGKGNINAVVNFADTLVSIEKMTAQVLPSHLDINESVLQIEPSTVTVYKDGTLDIDNFKITDKQSFLHLDGVIGKSKQDTISLQLKDFNIAGLNFLIKKKVNLRGTFNGNCKAKALLGKDFSFLADFSGNEIQADGEKVGDIRILSKWDEANQKINYLLSNTLNDTKPLTVVGSYNPNSKNLNLDVDIDKLNIGWIDPFLVSVVDHSVGTVSGKINISGQPDDIKIKSEGLRLNDLHTNLSYTEVPYILDGPFEIDEKAVTINNLSIKDTRGDSGTIKGNYWLAGKNKGQIDLLFDLKGIHGLNTTFQDANQGFYGDAHATGKVRVFGPMRGLRINIDIATEKGNIHIPLDETNNAKKRDILTFVNRDNIAQTAYDSLMTIRNLNQITIGRRKTGVKCNIRLKVSPLTDLTVDINRANGDRAVVKGNGQVEMRTGEGQFDIRGNYVINEGNCHFSILGITAKDFSIKEGGTINFVGPVMQTDFKLAAVYQTKAAIETLLGDSQSVSTRRTVNCIVNLTGKISNPEIAFKIEVPDLDPSYKNKLDSALSTDEKNLRQGLALLVSGGFIPDQQSGIVNNSTFLYSNASEIVSSQISNIFHQLNIPVDLGLKYQPGSRGYDIFDVAISTQLFNNRVTINGSIGNKEYSTTGSNSDIIGNIDVGIKLNKTGQFKLNLFSHAADQYSNYLDQSQRNGAGVTYQEEFATFKELWELMFKRKQKQSLR